MSFLFLASSNIPLAEITIRTVQESVANKIEEEGPELKMKRKRDPSTWKKNVCKQKRLKGEAYLGTNKKQQAARPILPSPCALKEKHTLCNSVSEDARQQIYNTFRNLPSIDDQRQFVGKHIARKPKGRTTRKILDSRKSYTHEYSFTLEGKKIVVCREFFMCTLNTTDSFMRTSLAKINVDNIRRQINCLQKLKKKYGPTYSLSQL